MVKKLKERAFDGRRFGESERIAKERSINEGYFEQDYDDDIREKANELGFSGMSGEDFPFYTNSQGIVPQYDLGDLFDWIAQVELPDDPYKLEIYIGVLMDKYRLPEFRYSANGFEYTDYLDEAIGELKYNYIIDDAGIEDAEYNEIVERGISELERIVEDYTDRVYDLVDFVKQAQLDLIESQGEYDERKKGCSTMVRRLRESKDYGLGYYIEGKRRMRSGSRLTESENDNAAIIQKFEDYGFYQDDPSDPRYFYDGMPFRFYATYNSEDDVAYIEFNPAGNAVEVYYADINSVDDADNFLQKLYDWEEYDVFDLLEMGLIAFGFRKDGAWSYIGQNDFGENIRVDFNEDTMTLLDDGYGESQTLSIYDGFYEFLAK